MEEQNIKRRDVRRLGDSSQKSQDVEVCQSTVGLSVGGISARGRGRISSKTGSSLSY